MGRIADADPARHPDRQQRSRNVAHGEHLRRLDRDHGKFAGRPLRRTRSQHESRPPHTTNGQVPTRASVGIPRPAEARAGSIASSETKEQGRRRGAARGHPVPRAAAGRHDPRAGGERCLRSGREHPPDRDPLPQGAGSAQPQAAGTDDRAAGSGARDQRRARVQLLPSPGQRGRGSARARRGAGGGEHRRRAGAAARRPRADQEDHLVLRAGARRAGADRAPDGGAAQEHARSPSRRHRSAGGARRAAGRRTSRARPCGARSC